MNPPKWVQGAVFYQIFPDRFRNGDPRNDPPGARPWGELPDRTSFFGGDLWGILEKLDYLEDLGITALYLTPIFEAPTNHKYDTEDYFQVDPAFGGNEALQELVRALHARGMRIVLDGVFNHCGERHPFFQDVLRQGRASPYWDWFTVYGERILRDPEPNYACFAGVPSMPEWNHANPKVREYLLSVVRHWLLEYEIDGWRLDTGDYLSPDFVRELYHAAKGINPEAYIVGEVWGIAASWFKHGALDGVMHYKLWEGLVHFFAQGTWDARRFADYVYSLWRSYPEENGFACYTLLGSHDKPRFLTLCQGDKRRLLLAAAFLFSFPGAPAIYYGDEIGMEGGEDPDCRRCFAWDQNLWDQETLAAFRELVRLRRGEPALRGGELHFVGAHGRTLCLRRTLVGEEVLVALNAGDGEQAFPLPGRFRDLLAGEEVSGEVALPPWSFRILKRRR
ncbi:DUF3459 domain-containing protein [Candidatus Bipolaricaulota bacterium]|nr:DUF3459 domain-containing protein [Candidatus Bipolaricaulota bacterium]